MESELSTLLSHCGGQPLPLIVPCEWHSTFPQRTVEDATALAASRSSFRLQPSFYLGTANHEDLVTSDTDNGVVIHPRTKHSARRTRQHTSKPTMSSLLDKMNKKMHDVGSQIKDKLNASADKISHSHTSPDGMCSDGAHSNTQHRYHSFAPQREGNELKWYVNGCSYMWAVSVAIEQAKESIWILDCV